MNDPTEKAAQWLNNGSKLIRKDAKLSAELIKKALTFLPTCSEGWYNLGLALHQNKKICEAIKGYRLALDYSKSNQLEINAKNNLAQDLLLNGKWEEGFKVYESRFMRSKTNYEAYINMFGKAWEGWNDPRGCEQLVIVSEQGLGDTIQFIRLLKIIQDKGIRTSFFGPEELRQLLRKGTSLGPFTSVLNNENRNTRWCTLLSIPHLIGLTQNTIPLKEGYIKPDPKIVAEWRSIIRQSPNKKLVAIHWQGNPKFEKSNYSQGRSMPLMTMQKLGSIKDVEYLSLQKGKAAKELSNDNLLPMVNGQELFSQSMNFEDTAAALACCDLLISTDSSVVHLAGAMGIPVWVALSWVPEWRWGLSGTKSLWYEKAYLFRQKKAGDWDQVIDDIRRKLKNELSRKGNKG